jgi:PemK-like, MazF-like toxin of type II toxin-antitoxin system
LHIQRNLLDGLRKDRQIKRNPVRDNTDVMGEIDTLIPVIENHLKQGKVEKASNWMLFKDLWLQNELGHLRRSTSYRNYTRGSIIMSLDWGTSNIGTEIRYPHPGVVLYDKGEDWIIAAPITGAKIDRSTNKPVAHPPFEVLAPKQNKKPKDPNEYWFVKHSVIQVDQIQRISKYRAVNKNSYKIRKNLINEIDNLILEYYLPGKHQLVEMLKEVINEKDRELEEAKSEIESLKIELESLRKKK